MKRMIPNRGLRIALVAVISLVLGYALMAFIVTAPFLVDTTLGEYTWGPEHPIPLPYAFLTGLFIALGIAVWLDKFFETGLLPK